MRIQHLYISEYKNLKNFTLEFDGTSFIDVFVGKNGTGKSNLFEALIEIFRHLFDKDYPILFDYVIKYTIEGKAFEVKWSKDELEINGKKGNIKKDILPDNIIIYYSGHNAKIADLVSVYENDFKGKVKGAKINDIREFIGIGKDYKSLLLAVLLLQSDDNTAKKYIQKKLGIKTISHEVKIVLKRPNYAFGKEEYNVEIYDQTTAFWKADGIVGEFLKKLSDVKKGVAIDGKEREVGHFKRIKNEDEYILYYDIADFQKTFKDSSSLDLFRHLDNLKTIEMLKEISIIITLEDGTDANINNFSDGQFQMAYIYSIIEIFKDRNCLTILDEPDAFLHPEWQFEFLKQVFEIDHNANHNNQVLMSSHSAITLLQSEEKRVNLFKLHKNEIVVQKVGKDFAINQLSSDLLKLKFDKSILSIIYTLGQNKPILFTEGNSDPIILRKAYQALYESDEIPFEICFGHGCLYLRLLLQNEKFLKEMNGKPIFGLFDFDEAYEQWNSIRNNKDWLVNDPYLGLTKQFKDFESYAIVLPIPEINEIKKQVIKDGKTFEGNSKLELEHLFYSEKSKAFFSEKDIVGGGKIIEISDSQKMKFAIDYVQTLKKEDFEVLKPVFEFIKATIGVLV
jgi:predicted ATPase